MNSIEGAYVSISHQVLQAPGELGWWPFWYGGIPFQNTYPPLLHMLVALCAKLSGFSVVHSHHFVTAMFYCAGPVGVYLLAARLSGSVLSGVVVGVLYSAISPCVFLVRNIRYDVGGFLHLRRLHTLLAYGDGPHISALALVPFALLTLDWALEKKRPWPVLCASLAMAAVALTNWLGAFALALAVLAYLVARGNARFALPVVGIGVGAYLLAATWIPLSTIRVIQLNSQSVEGTFDSSLVKLVFHLFIAAILLGFGKLVFSYFFDAGIAIEFAVYFAFLTASITLLSEWGGISVVPQPQRYHLEMDLGICLAVGLLAAVWMASWPRWAVAGVLVLLAFGPWLVSRPFYRDLIQPVDMTKAIEYQVPTWFQQNAPGSRAMVPGTIAFWMNAFSDTPLLNGGFDQGVVNPEDRIAIYIVQSADGAGTRGGEIALLWLRAFGVNWLSPGGPESREAYRAFRDVGRFAPLMKEVWRDGGDVICQVPRRSTSLAQVVRREDLVSRAPANGIDIEPMQRYVAALEDPSLPLASFRWLNRHAGRAEAELQKGQVISVQVAYHEGWKAQVNGVSTPVRRDEIGLMYIDSGCQGHCAVDLNFDGGVEMWVCRALTGLGLLGFAAWFWRPNALLRVWT